MIARNEEDNLPELLDIVAGAFDEIVLVDTGSDDRTVEIFRDWCDRTGQAHAVDSFEWVDDFAAARQYAYGLLTTEWTCWADADDSIIGSHELRRLAAEAPPSVAGYAADYEYEFVGGECVSVVRLERLVRASAGLGWVGRTHDAQIIDGPIVFTSDVLWVHRGSADLIASAERDRRVLEAWYREEPDNPYVMTALWATYKAPELHAIYDLSHALALTVEMVQAAEVRGVNSAVYRERVAELEGELSDAIARYSAHAQMVA